MNKKILWCVLASAGLALAACGTKDGPNSTGQMTTNMTGMDTGSEESSGGGGTVNPTTGMTGMDTGPGDSGGSDTAPPMTGVGFIEDPDGGGVEFECDIFAQDCPENEKCMPWASDGSGAWNATRCSPIMENPGQAGDECSVEGSGTSGIDTCDIGVMCWDVDGETNMGTCVAMCTGDAGNPICEDPDTQCSIANDGAIVLCLPSCQPLIQDCAEGSACYPIGDAFVCAPDASGPDAGLAGSPCEFINACKAGLFCLGAAATQGGCMGSSGCCSEACDLLDAGFMCAGSGQECTPWYEDGAEPPGYEDVGACALPA